MTILLILIGVMCLFLPAIRIVLFHPFKTLRYVVQDMCKYIKYKKWRLCKAYGTIDMYSATGSHIFGCGKTLSGVHYVCALYRKYNGKRVYNERTNEWEEQRIRIVSNVELNIPYVKLESTEDIVDCHKGLNEMSVAIILIDEASTQFNSRNFKTNISSTLLNSMLTCRHHKFGMVLTSQRYLHVDALIRQITNRVICCRKIWRIQMLYSCSAWDLENCTNVKLVKHITRCWFVENKDYEAYDTSAIVDEIKRKQANGELLSDSEVLALQGDSDTDVYKLEKRTRRVKKINVR